jgi:RNA polymerase sigma-70 factor (ECF subfamily)
VYNFTLRKVRNPTEAEDLVQEIFYCIFTSLKSFEGRSSLLSWIYGIMKNNINNYFRRNKNSDVPMNDEDRARLGLEKTSPEYGPDLQLEMKEAIESFDRALRALSDSQYQVFKMRHMENLSIAQIAKVTNKSADSIKSNLYRIKKLLTPGGETENQSLAWV